MIFLREEDKQGNTGKVFLFDEYDKQELKKGLKDIDEPLVTVMDNLREKGDTENYNLIMDVIYQVERIESSLSDILKKIEIEDENE